MGLLKKQKFQGIITIFVFILLIEMLMLLNYASKIEVDAKNYIALNQGWNVTINDTEYDNVELGTLSFPLTDKGDVVTLSCNLPDLTQPMPILRVYNIHSDILVTLDGEEIYAYGQDLYAQGKMLGYGYHFVDLPDDFQGKRLEIRMVVSENDAYSSLEIPEICNGNTMIRDYIAQNRIPLAINVFLIIFGLCLAAVIAVAFLRSKELLKLICVAFFSIGIGVWSFCSYDLVFLFTYNIRMKVYLEFWALYLSPIFVFWYFADTEFNNENRLVKYAYRTLSAMQVLFWVLVGIFQATDYMHLPAMLKYEHMLVLVMVIYLAAMFIYEIRHHEVKKKVLLVGISIMIIFIIGDLLKFNLQKYTNVFGTAKFISSMCIGTLIFVISLIMDFCYSVAHALYNSAKKETLERLAYMDSLTGLANRRKCEEVLDSIQSDGKPYSIISFDMNNLKTTNDTQGHEAGDVLLRAFSDALKAVFEEYGTVGRMGGDEFLVIYPGSNHDEVDKRIHLLIEKLAKQREIQPELKLSTSYGVCHSTEEKVQDYSDAIRIADERMYQNKAEYKGK